MNNLENLKIILNDPKIKNVFILPHNMPDGDTIGSAIGVYHLVQNFDKRGYIVLNDGIPSNLSFLLSDGVRIHKSSDVKSVDVDVAIVVDCGETKLFEDRIPLFQKAKHTFNIDHHLTNSNYAENNYVNHEASSTGEMIYLIYDELNVKLNSDGARAIYAAIVTDTGSFRYSNTRPLTFKVCERLIEFDFDFNQLNVELFQNKSLEKLQLLNHVFSTLHLYLNGKCAVVRLTEEMIDSLNFSEYDTDGIVEFIRDIQGVEVVVFMRHLKDSAYKISMRSKNDIDVSAIALKFKGGGHKKAAGFKIEMPCEQIEKLVVEAIEEAI